MAGNRKRNLRSAIKSTLEPAEEVSDDFMWIALDFLRSYTGTNQVLRSMAAKAVDPDWRPSDRQVIQVHRIVTAERRRKMRLEQDSLGRRLRRADDADLPDSLSEPDWL